MTTPPVVDVEGLDVRYGTNHAVRDVSMRIHPGERVAIVGESGSGKSSLVTALVGHLPAGVGTASARAAQVLGAPLDLRPRRRRLPQRLPGVSVIVQDAMTSLDPLWTLDQQLRTVLRATHGLSRRAARGRAVRQLAALGLTDPERVLAARPHELSGGMRQRAMIAIALSSNPSLLIADEPTSALDVSLAVATMHLLTEVAAREGAALLLISHDLELCARFTDRLVVMRHGRVVEELRTAELDAAQHPYTRGLLACVPTLASADLDLLPVMPDELDLVDVHPGGGVE